jgi:alkylation response protein AidB-like acyl-CoA dehydrogenase
MSTALDAAVAAPGIGAELQGTTSAGAVMIERAEAYASDFADAALGHDRSGVFADHHLAQLRADRFLYAPIPATLGGAGVDSVHDVLVAMSRLARGDAATSIGVNMHFAVLLNLIRGWRVADRKGNAGRADLMASRIRDVAARGDVFAAAVSEPAPQDLARPATTAVRVGDGWRINGRKIFCTMASAASVINVAVSYSDDNGDERYGMVFVPRDSVGLHIPDDWDAIGMRASDSGSLTLHEVGVGASALADIGPAGRQSCALLDRFLAAGGFHAAAALGVAESAHSHVVDIARARPHRIVADTHAAMRLAENVVELAAMRASLHRAGHLIDAYHHAFPLGDATLGEVQAVYGEVQAAKAYITEAASRVTDRALVLSGGVGYMAHHPLAKAWRDARAGVFMHPLGANRVYDFLARAAVGLDPLP